MQTQAASPIAVSDEPAEHFRLYLRAAIYHLIWHLNDLVTANEQDLDVAFMRFPFLTGYFRELLGWMPPETGWDEGTTWWRDQIAAWERDASTHLPLLGFDEEQGIAYRQRLAFVFCGLPDEDSRFGSVIAWLQAPLDARRPSIELVGRIAGCDDAWALCRPLVENHLVRASGTEGPRSEWVLKALPELWDVLRGERPDGEGRAWRVLRRESFPAPHELVFPAHFGAQLAGTARLLREGEIDVVVARGSEGSDRLATIGAIARELGRDVLALPSPATVDLPAWIGPFATLTHSMPVYTFELGPGESASIPRLEGYRGPLGILLGLEGGLESEGLERSLTFDLPGLGPGERLRRWSAAFDGYDVDGLEAISARYLLPGEHINTVATMARTRARLRDDGRVRIADVRAASRALNRQQLDSLADFLEPDGSWERLITSSTTTEKLRELEARCRQREVLPGKLGRGFGVSATSGVRALFSGPSGTGKTLAARTLAAELGMDLYRVDLASVINKYIGETEKNLHRVLSRAEELDVVLLLDEGDALLGARTEVRSSNDRYANLETNYLLQRLEHYRGIIVVTTNAGQNIDPAFQRRMDIVVPFLPPRGDERRRIWDLHLPDDHLIDPATLDRVALRCAFTGGQIRNAALLATLLAVESGAGQVREDHLVEAIQSEYRKSGASLRLHLNGSQRGGAQSVAAFVGSAPTMGGRDGARESK